MRNNYSRTDRRESRERHHCHHDLRYHCSCRCCFPCTNSHVFFIGFMAFIESIDFIESIEIMIPWDSADSRFNDLHGCHGLPWNPRKLWFLFNPLMSWNHGINYLLGIRGVQVSMLPRDIYFLISKWWGSG